MSDDLVKRMRKLGIIIHDDGSTETPDELDRLRAENERLREALIDAVDMLSGATFEVMRVRGQYIDRKDVVCRARAALQTEGGE